MTPNDYKKAAEKHLNFCNDWKNRIESSVAEPEPKNYELLEIYYLSGYIAECLTIYTIYAVGGWNPTGLDIAYKPKRREALEKLDIEEYFDPVFTHFTRFDYYKRSEPPIGSSIKTSRKVHRQIKSFINGDFDKADSKEFSTTDLTDKNHYLWKKTKGESVNLRYDLGKCIFGNEIEPSALQAVCCVAGHQFQEAIYNVILRKLNVIDALNTVNFFQLLNVNRKKKDGEIAYKLLDKWGPEIRYYSNRKKWEQQFNAEDMLTKPNLIRLINELNKFSDEIKKLL